MCEFCSPCPERSPDLWRPGLSPEETQTGLLRTEPPQVWLESGAAALQRHVRKKLRCHHHSWAGPTWTGNAPASDLQKLLVKQVTNCSRRMTACPPVQKPLLPSNVQSAAAFMQNSFLSSFQDTHAADDTTPFAPEILS